MLKMFFQAVLRRITGKFKEIGSMNGWKEAPMEYEYHEKRKHKVWVFEAGRCYHKYTCPECMIKWSVDSGD